MSSNPTISLRNVGKTYRAYDHPIHRLLSQISGQRIGRFKDFHIFKNISFDIHKGETVGIIGKNGSGKSTLLQIICGIRKPTSGTVSVNGRISALLELGSGFQPEFSGHDNIYLQGAIEGLTREEMQDRFPKIIAFADIGDYVDQPVKNYSTGMFVRLAFAVAVHTDPDILIVDEVLAVGDAFFQQKCIEQIIRLQENGTSILVVSHNPYHIERLCHRAAVLHRGQLSELMPAKEILMRYHEMVQEDLTPSSFTKLSYREGTHEVYFESVHIEEAAISPLGAILPSGPMRIVAEIFAERPMRGVRFRFEFCSANNEIVTVAATNGISENWQLDGHCRISFAVDDSLLTSGWYYINAIAGSTYVRLDTWQRALDFKILLQEKEALDLSLDQGVFVSKGSWEIFQSQNRI